MGPEVDEQDDCWHCGTVITYDGLHWVSAQSGQDSCMGDLHHQNQDGRHWPQQERW